ncbi:phosphotriesterase-related protein-like isoform X1 [Polyergus mexicanus]|uniref:phosphotriesterase-related protein-like isoform X1 n=1 Tax=Polyergus mexicanus TaxID=615972 RepID=UPI0038B49EE1
MAGNFPATVETVLGSIRLSELGRTLTHEHLALDFRNFYIPPPKHIEKHFSKDLHLANIGYIRQYPYSSLSNLEFYDDHAEKAVHMDVKLFKEAGGGTIVENSSHGLRRDILLMRNVSQSMEVNVIAGTGYYVASTQTASTLNITKEEMYNLMYRELEESCVGCPNGLEVKAGFIGEVGSTWPIEDFEKRAISATGELQAQLHCSVSFHPGRDMSAPTEIMRIYQEAGGDPTRAIMSHIDRTLINKEQLMEFADDNKCYIQFDLFGIECSYYQMNPSVDMPSDAQRIKRITRLKKEGKLHRVLMSHDIHTKHRLVHFGGHGYSHIANNILPIMINKGFTMEEIELITVENPKRWFTRQ